MFKIKHLKKYGPDGSHPYLILDLLVVMPSQNVSWGMGIFVMLVNLKETSSCRLESTLDALQFLYLPTEIQ